MKLFKIVNNITKKEIHLGGTFHNIKLNVLPQVALNFINNHDTLVVESSQILEPLSIEALEKMNLLKKNFNENIELESHEYATIKKNIEAFFEQRQVSKDVSVDMLNIDGLYHIFEQSLCLNGMDNAIIQEFKNTDKNIEGLESREEVALCFEHKTKSELKNLLSSDRDNAIIQAFCNIRNKFVYFMNFAFEPFTEDTIKEFSARNSKWIPKILHSSESCIIMVGAYHLYEEYGLLSQLENLGYSISQMDVSGEFKKIDNSSMHLVPFNINDFKDFVAREIRKTYGLHGYNNYIKLLNEALDEEELEVISKFLSHPPDALNEHEREDITFIGNNGNNSSSLPACE